ncbi:hypothetical protein LIPSTDRAFT_76624, partial [Lipomyces starkeyi NRRL Y-11557]
THAKRFEISKMPESPYPSYQGLRVVPSTINFSTNHWLNLLVSLESTWRFESGQRRLI